MSPSRSEHVADAGAPGAAALKEAARAMRPWDAWFESGKEPVLAVSAKDEETSFIRVSVLPAEIRGKSSMMYVDPGDAGRSKPRTYTVYVDEPIAL